MRALRRIPSRAAVLSAVLLLAAGCGGEDDGEKVPKTATGTVEQLAEKAKCKPDMQIDATEIRQGICKTRGGKYVLATFKTNIGQQNWLSSAQAYGGSYLVGRKWVAVGDPKVIGSLRGRLGGEVETAPDHGHSSGGGPSHKEHSGHQG
ncbi:hypothetical protein [Streptomyces sp. 8N616]|uniref:hypothetical protein n=1 Tax=Streptomyces sp. 8N616 TaxID=3457414 RepID=UPI003FD2C14C